ncbi:MAG TPA: hypothetical protein GXX75_07085 [Clostridiales bacterium]|nr:hypothetical protein [Clostridiales bacterium]
MRRQRHFILILIVLSSLYLGGCNQTVIAKTSLETENADISGIPKEPTVIAPETSRGTPDESANAPSKEPAIAETPLQNETVFSELDKDIDNNGIMDSVQLLERTDGTMYAAVILNGETIFHYEWEDLRLMSVNSFEYLDFDQDHENEIFITIDPLVNSMPLTEVLTLKLSDGQWRMMDIPLNEIGNNCFPITITKGDGEFDFILSSEYTDKQLLFDATSYYTDDGNIEGNSIQLYKNQHFSKGDTVGYVSSWGIWSSWTGTYDGRNCIIAEQGLQGIGGKFNPLGRVDIYYAFDKNGNIEILDLVHIE